MSVSKSFASVVGAVLMAFGATAVAQAATIVPVSAVGSSSYPGYNDFYAIDNSLLTDWSSFGQGANSVLNLDLGDVFTLDTAYVTDRTSSGGGNGCGCFGLWDFTTMFSLQAFTDSSFTTGVGTALTFNHATPGSPADFTKVAALGGLSGQYIQYKVLASNGANAGLADIHFSGSAGVPEPAAWVLMITGFGAAGAMMRRRRALAFAKV